MFGQKKTARSYEQPKRKYKKAPKKYRSKTSRSLKEFYTRGYKQPKQPRMDTYKFKAPREKKVKKAQSDQINFKIPHQKMKEKKPPKSYTINDMSRKARKSLYTHQTKQPRNDETSGIHFKATHGIGALYKGNAVHDKVSKNDAQSKAQRRNKHYLTFYLITTCIAVLGLILSVVYKTAISSLLFVLLLLISLYGSYTYMDQK